MSLFRNLLKLIPNKEVRSITRQAGHAAERTLAHEVYNQDRSAFFNEAEKNGERITRAEFSTLPTTLADLLISPYNDLRTPINGAALFVVALNVYNNNRDEAIAMINYLRGSNPMPAEDVRSLDLSLIKHNSKNRLTRSYFDGANRQNDFVPSEPFTVVVVDNPYTYLATNSGAKEYAHLFIQCGGTENPRSLTLKNDNGLWYLWEYSSLLEDI